jgi:hypothetical protein
MTDLAEGVKALKVTKEAISPHSDGTEWYVPVTRYGYGKV